MLLRLQEYDKLSSSSLSGMGLDEFAFPSSLQQKIIVTSKFRFHG